MTTALRPAVLLFVVLSVFFVKHASAFAVCLTALPGVGKGAATPSCDYINQNPFIYLGPEVEMFRAIAAQAGWTYDQTAAGLLAPFATKRFGFRCLVGGTIEKIYTLLLANLTSARCHMTFQGQSQSSAMIDPRIGMKASQPHATTTFSIAVYDEGIVPVDMWAFLKPLDWKLWIIFTVTILTLPVLVWVIEKLNSEGHIPLNNSSSVDLRFAVYRNILAIFTQDIMFVSTTGAQVTMLTFLLLTFVTMASYTASLASYLTLTSTKLTANNLGDFAGKKIAISKPRGPFVESMYGIYDYEYTTSGGRNETLIDLTARYLEQLRNKNLSALFMERGLLENGMAVIGDPKLRLVGQDVQMSLLGAFFHKDFPDDMIATFDAALMISRDRGLFGAILDGLLARLVPPPAPAATATEITYTQMFGLFIILYSAIGGGLLVTLFVYIYNKRRGAQVKPTKEEVVQQEEKAAK